MLGKAGKAVAAPALPLGPGGATGWAQA